MKRKRVDKFGYDWLNDDDRDRLIKIDRRMG